jgi:hypothetical protein
VLGVLDPDPPEQATANAPTIATTKRVLVAVPGREAELARSPVPLLDLWGPCRLIDRGSCTLAPPYHRHLPKGRAVQTPLGVSDGYLTRVASMFRRSPDRALDRGMRSRGARRGVHRAKYKGCPWNGECMGWLEGALRPVAIFCLQIFGCRVPEILVPGVVFPSSTFALSYGWPSIEALHRRR